MQLTPPLWPLLTGIVEILCGSLFGIVLFAAVADPGAVGKTTPATGTFWFNGEKAKASLTACVTSIVADGALADGGPSPHAANASLRALARHALFERDDGAALVGVNQRCVEPRTLLQKLQIARAVGIDVGEAD